VPGTNGIARVLHHIVKSLLVSKYIYIYLYVCVCMCVRVCVYVRKAKARDLKGIVEVWLVIKYKRGLGLFM